MQNIFLLGRLQVKASIAEIWNSCSLLGAYDFDPQVPKYIGLGW